MNWRYLRRNAVYDEDEVHENDLTLQKSRIHEVRSRFMDIDLDNRLKLTRYYE